MKIEAFFQRQTKADKPKPTKPPAAAEQGKQADQKQLDQVANDTLPDCDRDVDKAGGSGGPLSECTNKRGSAQLPQAAPPAKKQHTQQDVQEPIDLCDDDDDDTTPAAAAAAPLPPNHTSAADVAATNHQGQVQLLAPHQQQQQDREDPKQQQADNAMEVDGADLATLHSLPSSRAASPSTQDAAAVLAPAAATTPAPAAAAQQEPATPAGALTAGAGGAAAPSAMKSTGGKAAAEALLTPEQRQQLLEACQQELPLLESELDVQPDLSGHLCCESKKPLDLKQKVSLLTEGQQLPLTQLAELISKTLSSGSAGGSGSPANNAAAAAGGPSQAAAEPGGTQDAAAAAAAAPATADGASNSGGSSGPSALVVRNLIQEVACRKSYGLQSGALADVDALEDATASFHWCWELRTLTGLPKAAKQHADAVRKHRKQVLDRLKAASAFVQLVQTMSKPTKTAEGKIARAAGKLGKTSPLTTLQAQLQAAVEAAEQHSSSFKAKQAVSRLEKAAKEEQAAQAKAEKAQAAEAEKAAREAEKAAKEEERLAKEAAKAAEAAEKAKLKAEKDAEREAKRREKAAEAEKKAAEAAKRKEKAEAAKAGFGSTTGLHKAQNVFKTFFGLPAQRPPTPSGGETSQGQGSQMDGGSHHKEQSKEAARLWTPVVGPTQQQLSEAEALEQQLPYFSGSGDTSAAAYTQPELLATTRQHWRSLRRQNNRVWGMPPSWALRPGVFPSDPGHVERAAAALYGEGFDINRLRCWRRKLIKHHDSVRPPFYGSVPRSTSAAVSGRRPLGKDVQLDYEEMSDQDWEEEPEGESLSADEDGDEEGVEEGDDDEEGFVVGDGYLSDDEGLMRDDDEPLGCTGSQLAAAAAAAAAAGGGGCGGAAGSSDSSATALAHLEAVLDHARSKGRHVLLVNNCPEMQWEPTTQLPPSILTCLRAKVMRTDVTCAPPTPADLPHIFGSTVAAASAAAAAAAAAGSTRPSSAAAAAGDGSSPDAAAAAGGMAAAAEGVAGAITVGGGASGGRGRPPSVFPETLLPALVALVHNSKASLDQLVKQFVQQQADAGVKIAKARVRDKIKEISTMRMVSKAPLYTVKPEVLQALQQQQGGDVVVGGTAAAAAAAAGVEGAAAGDAAAAAEVAAEGVGGGDAMQVDGVAAAVGAAEQPAGVQQQQDQLAAAVGVAAATAPTAPTAGALKRPAADAAQEPQQQQGEGGASKVGEAGGVANVTSSCPPAKKQKATPLSSGIARFFSAAKEPKSQQQQQEQQPQQGTPPSTPKHKLPAVPSLHLSELQAAAEAGGVGVAAGGDGGGSGEAVAGAGVGVERSGALPMLTPPSHVAAEDRRSKGRHSPVPFRLNSLHALQEADAADAAGAAADVPAATAAAAAGKAGAEEQQPPQQKQPGRQDISAIFRRQQQWQQQERGGVGATQAGGSQGGLLGGSVASLSPGGAAGGGGGHKPSRLGAGAGPSSGAAGGGSNSGSISPPQLPESGAATGSLFWKQLAQWVVAVREPSESDISTAFEVFTEGHLSDAVRTMPQVMLSAMVKTLGSHMQSLAMRSACARCISNAVHSLVGQEQELLQQQHQQQQQDGGNSTPVRQQQQGANGRAGTASPAAAGTSAAAAGAGAGTARTAPSPSPTRSGLAAAASASPSPSASPRSAPVGATYEELCAEPHLLDNLLLCLNPEKCMDGAKKARGQAGLGIAAAEEAELLAKNAARAVSSLLMVGLSPPAGAGVRNLPQLQECSAVTAAAAAQLRLKVASVASWRGVLRASVRSEDTGRAGHALIAQYAMLVDPVACSKLVANMRLATGLFNLLASKGSGKDNKWAVSKWCLLVLSALLSDPTIRSWALPWGTALKPLGLGNEETCSALEGMAVLLTIIINRPKPGLGEDGSADRDLLSRCLALCDVLSGFLADQAASQQQEGGALPVRLAQLFDEVVQQEHCSLRDVLQGVAQQTAWDEAAQHAQRLLNAVDGGSGVQHTGDVEMQA